MKGPLIVAAVTLAFLLAAAALLVTGYPWTTPAY